LQLSRKLLLLELYCSTPEIHETSSKAGSWINILSLLTGPIQKSMMVAAAIWKIEKSHNVCYGWTSFEKILHGDVL